MNLRKRWNTYKADFKDPVGAYAYIALMALLYGLPLWILLLVLLK